jgi:hypothetical protein
MKRASGGDATMSTTRTDYLQRYGSRMKQFIERTAVRIGALVQVICANVDLEVLSLPGGSLIAVLLSLYAIAKGSTRGAATQIRASARGTSRSLYLAEALHCSSPEPASQVLLELSISLAASRDFTAERSPCVPLEAVTTVS